MSDRFGDVLGDIFDDGKGGRHPRQPQPPAVEKGIPWHAKRIDGALYVPLAEVAELLRQNGVLPKVRAGLEKHLDTPT